MGSMTLLLPQSRVRTSRCRLVELHPLTHLDQSTPHLGLHGTERHAGRRRDFGVRHPFEQAHAQHLALVGPQPRHDRRGPLGFDARLALVPGLGPAQVLEGVLGIHELVHPVAPDAVDQPPAGNRRDEHLLGALRGIEPVRAAPDVHEDFLHCILGIRASPRHAPRDCPDETTELIDALAYGLCLTASHPHKNRLLHRTFLCSPPATTGFRDCQSEDWWREYRLTCTAYV
jgi:hypothetical protein